MVRRQGGGKSADSSVGYLCQVYLELVARCSESYVEKLKEPHMTEQYAHVRQINKLHPCPLWISRKPVNFYVNLSLPSLLTWPRYALRAADAARFVINPQLLPNLFVYERRI